MNQKITRLPALPLITHDPFFSIWDPNYTPTGGETRHWSGAMKRIIANVEVDGKRMRIMGTGGIPAMPRVGVDLTPLSTIYRYEAMGIRLTMTFTSPLLPDDLEILSTPISYVRFQVEFIDGKDHKVAINFGCNETFVHAGEIAPKLRWDDFSDDMLHYAYLGQMKQNPLSGAGDQLSIDWGYLFFASDEGEVNNNPESVYNVLRFHTEHDAPFTATLMVGYDDVASINYFGALLPAYYARNGKNITQAFREFYQRKDEILNRCDAFDAQLLKEATDLGGEDYALVICASYRQSVAAHKMVADRNGDALFISKENDSNGCAATVDISYPSAPLFLMYCPELVRGMLRPIFKFARMDIWNYDFAPHDVGCYPVLNGQVYGAVRWNKHYTRGDTEAPYYLYPTSVDAYQFERQMPVEECGNMLLMVYSACLADSDFTMARENLDLLRKWSHYLTQYGEDPGEQLCTDDFAGHLKSNVNLSAKAMMGVAAYSKILQALGEAEEGAAMWQKAKDMANSWLQRADMGGYTALTFEKVGWSQKYNLVWDKLFGWGLLPDRFYEAELKSYLPHINEFGLPLDSRASYTKSDWTMWVAAMAQDRATFDALCAPLAHYLRQRRSPVPFSDFYDTVEGVYDHFIGRSVQGGTFMPLLVKQWADKRA